MTLDKNLIVFMPRNTENTHVDRNIAMFAKLGIQSRYMDNQQLLREDLSQYDAVYLNWFENIDGGAAYRSIIRYFRCMIQLKKMERAGCKIIFCKHNRFPHDPKFPALSKNLYHALCRKASVIVSFTEDASEDFKELFPSESYDEKIEVIPPLNYIGAYPEDTNSEIRPLLKPYAEKMIVTFIGKIGPYKNVELIIRAAEERKDIVFVIAGKPASPEYGALIQSLCEGKENIILLLKRIPDGEICPLIKASDIMIMPYDTRSASNSGTGRLAFSYGRTVISPDIASMRQIPSEWIYSYHYVSPDEHYTRLLEQLSLAWTDWKTDPRRLEQKGEQLRKLMETDYSEAAIQSKYEEIFRKLFS